MEKLSTEEVLAEFKKLPDWNRFPFPDSFYKHFNIPKPKPNTSLMEALTYTPPPSESTLGETRGPAEGGVRPVSFQGLPVSVEVAKPEPPQGDYLKSIDTKVLNIQTQSLVGSPALNDGLEICDVEEYLKRKSQTKASLVVS